MFEMEAVVEEQPVIHTIFEGCRERGMSSEWWVLTVVVRGYHRPAKVHMCHIG